MSIVRCDGTDGTWPKLFTRLLESAAIGGSIGVGLEFAFVARDDFVVA